MFSVAPLNANAGFEPSIVPLNSEADLDVSARPSNANVGLELSADPSKTKGGFEFSVLPLNINVGREPSAEALNVNVGLPSVELPSNVDTGLKPPAAPPNKDVGLDPSADLEPELVPPNEKTCALPKAGAPAGVEENVLLKVVELAETKVGLGGVNVEATPSTATGFPKRFVAEAEGELDAELLEVDVIPNGKSLAGSSGPAVRPKADTSTADFFDSSAVGSVGAEAPSVAPGGA